MWSKIAIALDLQPQAILAIAIDSHNVAIVEDSMLPSFFVWLCYSLHIHRLVNMF
jgi:hypothetical protein